VPPRASGFEQEEHFVYIKLRLVVERLFSGAPMHFDGFGKDQKTAVTLRPPGQGDNEEHLFYHTIGEAHAEVEPPRKAALTFEALWESRIPPGVDLSGVPEAIRANWKPGHFEKYEIPLARLHQSAQDFLNQTYKELVDAVRRVVAAACWRSALPCPPYLFRHGRMLWSMDGEDWRMAPVNFVVSDERPTWLTADSYVEVEELLRRGRNEPLGHELFREAWTQVELNPRSALAIGISALETGLKELISELVPDAEWLAKNAPSPPVFNMLREYVPLLPAKARINGRVLSPPEAVIKAIRSGIERRNRLVHGNLPEIEPQEVKKLLLAVRDVLWLCDYYRGLEWALDHLSPETRAALGV
jgi:hypothetical protein